MKTNRWIAAGALLAGCTVAQAAQDWHVTVTDANTAKLDCADSADANKCLQGTGKTNAFDDGATITITCATAAACIDIALQKANGTTPVAELNKTSSTATTRVYTLKTADFQGSINAGVFAKKKLLVALTVQPKAPAVAGGGDGGQAPRPRTLEDVIATSSQAILLDCPPSVRGSYAPNDSEGDSKATATLYVDALGNVISSPSDYSFDENDILKVYVIGDEDLLARLRVARTSDIRDVTILRNVGESTVASSIGRQGREGAPPCKMRQFTVENFAPGKGVVQISRVKGDEVAPIGTFDIDVAPLYSGIFTLGAARSSIVDRKFAVVPNNGSTVIGSTDVSDKDTVYSIFYTPFVWGKRDLEKPFSLSTLYKHINPTVGFVVDDVSNNFLVGLSLDLPRGVVVTAGRHYRRVTVLSKESGLKLGSPFTGASDTIPTAKSWENASFIAVSVDIRVMSQLIKNAFTGAAK